jgi:alanine-synthesizing transaminase
MEPIMKSDKLAHVGYDIRGPIMEAAKEMEHNGYKILKLNIGNPAPFGFDAPEEIIRDIILNMGNAQGYSDSQGIFSARKSIMQDCQLKHIQNVNVEDIYTGNGVSELIVLSLQALLNHGDEILIPAPDYPLWTAAVNLAGGKAVHYLCDESSDWMPDPENIRSKITGRTKGIVVINPNNPTGAVYSLDILKDIARIAEEHHLVVFSDEIYEKVLYDGAKHIPMATLSEDILFVTLNGLSKSHRIAGFRAGWMVLSGNKAAAADYVEGIRLLSNMRLCSNVMAQYAIQTALGGYQSLTELLLPEGRLYRQREICCQLLNDIPGISCVKPQGAFYVFPKLDIRRFGISNDYQFALDFLKKERVMIVQGSGFSWPEPDHFRIVYLPEAEILEKAITRLSRFLDGYKQKTAE